MRFTIQRAVLARMMRHAGRAVENRNIIPALGMVHLSAKQGVLRVTATDLDIFATASGETDVSIPGAICVDAKMLGGIVGKSGASEMTLDLADSVLRVTSDRSAFKLPTLLASDFPNIEDHDYTAKIDADLASLIAPVALAMSNDETRHHLSGTCLHADGNKLTAVATDGHRLAMNWVDSDATFDRVIVPRKAVSLIASGVCSLSLSSSKIRIAQGDMELVSKLVDAEFVDYERVIPSQNEKLVAVDRDEFHRASERVTAVNNQRGHGIRLSAAPGALSFWSRSELGEAIDEIEADYNGEPTNIGLNSQYLRDMLGTLPSGKVEVRLNESMSPALFKSDGLPNWLSVVMPMRVS